ncbi:MAG: DUF116 domain-containing protein [Nitrososphaerota archaeon]|nr:DUF116 domain-containing protein [Aigarchaeota archaeon]MDW8076487.1 DUF116 domain-containing protein [Nitrososphaerota archaeon]
MRQWRLIDTGLRPASENMALDDVILECKARNLVPDTVRFLRFSPPAALVGYHQDVEQEVRLEYAKENGIDVNRRLTGGGAIYFDSSTVGWEVIASKYSFTNYSLEWIFKTMCECVVNALKEFGLDARFRPRNDIEIDGRKISGTGGVEREGAFLFQGTLLVDFDIETMIKVLKIPIIKLKDKELESVRKRVTCLKWELGYVPDYEEIRSALIRGFEKTLNIELKSGELTDHELEVFEKRLTWFKSEEWIFMDRCSSKGSAMVHAVDKKPGGVIRVSLNVDKDANVIKSVLVTGDFFIFPQRAILDLEAALKFVPVDADKIREIVHKVFEEKQVRALSITEDDIVELILEALEKTELESYGIDYNEVNNVYPITNDIDSTLKNGFDYMLLPYCSKMVSCTYRRTDGCAKCGRCTVGDAYRLAEEFGLKPITIHNFEHLIEVLKTMRTEGARGFIGCCCEAFYVKHRDEMRNVGVPGIIIDIEDKTCYDLGKAEEAYRGVFEAQTKLNLELLKKVLLTSLKMGGVKCIDST